MFGFRPDGRRISHIDPIMRFAPYVMPQRVDSQVQNLQYIDCDRLTRYIRAQRDLGHTLSYADLVVAGYVRAISQHPELNRFVCNKQIFARNRIQVSMAVLKQTDDLEHPDETTIKVTFDPEDTIYDVHDKLQQAIDENRRPENKNLTDKVARVLLAAPGVLTVAMALVRLLDRYGLLPDALINGASPFHTGMFLTNMASLGMSYVHHHIYNFGTTSIFTSMGKIERIAVPGPDGAVRFQRMLTMGVVVDERIAYGASFGMAFGLWRDLMNDPVRLETPPESVKYDIPPQKMKFFRHKRTAIGA